MKPSKVSWLVIIRFLGANQEKAMREHGEREPVCKLRRELLPESAMARTLILNFQPPEL